jgi:hypothetical protein
MEDKDLQRLHRHVLGRGDEQAELTRQLIADVLLERARLQAAGNVKVVTPEEVRSFDPVFFDQVQA